MHSSRRSPEGCGAEYARKANQNDPPFGTEAPSDTTCRLLPNLRSGTCFWDAHVQRFSGLVSSEVAVTMAILGDLTYGTLGIEACYLSQGSKLVHEASSKARPPLPERCRSDIPASPFRHRGLRCVPAFRRLTPLLDQRTGIPSLRFNR